jgi:FXSXX-COOH protein
MNSTVKLGADELVPSDARDLRAVPLAELARLADGGAEVINDVVARMVDGAEGRSLVSATMFNSAI